MLNFQPHDYEQIEQSSLSSKWLSNIFTSGQSSKSPTKNETLNKSFTELLIQYVDRESKPMPRVSLDLASATSTTTSKQQQNLLIGSTNKKTDNPLFYPVSSVPPTQIFNPLVQTTTTTLLNRSTPGISTQPADYAILQSQNLSNRFTPSPSSSSQQQQQQQPLSNNNNSFLENVLN